MSEKDRKWTDGGNPDQSEASEADSGNGNVNSRNGSVGRDVKNSTIATGDHSTIQSGVHHHYPPGYQPQSDPTPHQTRTTQNPNRLPPSHQSPPLRPGRRTRRPQYRLGIPKDQHRDHRRLGRGGEERVDEPVGGICAARRIVEALPGCLAGRFTARGPERESRRRRTGFWTRRCESSTIQNPKRGVRPRKAAGWPVWSKRSGPR